LQHNIACIAWSPSGHFFATADREALVATIWDTATGKAHMTLPGHIAAVNCVAWSPDGQSIATASADKTAKIWDAATGQERLTLRGHTDAVNDVAWSPDGHILATASADWTVRQYVIATPDLLALADTRVTRSFTPQERALYFNEPMPTPDPSDGTP